MESFATHATINIRIVKVDIDRRSTVTNLDRMNADDARHATVRLSDLHQLIHDRETGFVQRHERRSITDERGAVGLRGAS